MSDQVWTEPLRTGESLQVVRTEAPTPNWAGPLEQFMYLRETTYTNCSWHLQCKRALQGEFAGVSRDVFFMGLLEGEIVSTTWYATPTDTGDVATFGRVLTRSDQRRKGISTVLCQAAVTDFREHGGWCMHLGTDLTNPARFIYEKQGFSHYNFIPGQGTIMRTVLRGEPEDFETEYFEPGWPTALRPLHWGDWPRAEVLYNLPCCYLKDYSLGIYANTPFEGQYYDLMTGLERNHARGWALTTEQGRLVGLAYPAAARAGAGAQEHLRTVEFVVHPWYADRAAELLATVAVDCEDLRLAAYASALDVTRCETLEEAGFEKEATLVGWLRDEDSEFDLYIYGYAG